MEKKRKPLNLDKEKDMKNSKDFKIPKKIKEFEGLPVYTPKSAATQEATQCQRADATAVQASDDVVKRESARPAPAAAPNTASRSQLRRLASQKGEPAPEFGPAAAPVIIEEARDGYDAVAEKLREYQDEIVEQRVSMQRAEIERLQKELKLALEMIRDAPTQEDMDAAQFSVNMDFRDACRYRFVRTQSMNPSWTGAYKGAELDAAIDKEIAKIERKFKVNAAATQAPESAQVVDPSPAPVAAPIDLTVVGRK